MSLLIASFKPAEKLAKKVAKKLKAQYTEIQTKDFPDEESYVKFLKNPKGKTVAIFNTFDRDQNNRLIETIFAAGIAKDFKAKKIILVAPYFPYLRQDTHFEEYDSFSIKYIKKILDNFDLIYTIEPHLQRISNIRKISYKMRKLSVAGLIADYISKHFKKDFTIIGPDKESSQWANKVAEYFGKRAIILKKIRFSWKKVKIERKNLGKNIIVIDDIIGTGGTILETIKIARAYNAKKILVIGVHGILVEDAAKKIKKHAALMTTNTIQNKFAKIDVFSVIANELKKSI